MKVNEVSTIIINSQQLRPGGIYCIQRKLKAVNEILIKGTVFNPDNTPSIGACIEVIEINSMETTLGYVFTNDEGKFGFTINYKPNVDYKLRVYSPISQK